MMDWESCWVKERNKWKQLYVFSLRLKLTLNVCQSMACWNISTWPVHLDLSYSVGTNDMSLMFRSHKGSLSKEWDLFMNVSNAEQNRTKTWWSTYNTVHLDTVVKKYKCFSMTLRNICDIEELLLNACFCSVFKINGFTKTCPSMCWLLS